jgi:phosphatidate cytidylyltransferase
MLTRVISSLVFGFLFLFISLQSFWWVLPLFALLHAFAQSEYCSLLTDLSPVARIVHVFGTTLAFLFISLSLAKLAEGEMIAVVLMIAVIYYAIRSVGAYESGADPTSYIRLPYSLFLITLPFAFCPAIATWPGEFPYMLLLIGASWGADTGAIFAGKLAGSVKLAPRTSPKKTVEGLIGGALAAAAVCGVAALLYPLDSPAAKFLTLGADSAATSALPGAGPSLAGAAVMLAVVGFILAMIGAFGDLLFSMFKRQAGIKDYGKIIKGHGGVLDRFDSFLLIAPLVYLLAVL